MKSYANPISAILWLLMVLSSYACGAATTPANGALRLQPSVVIDNGGFRQPMVAATIFTPHGWRTQGGIHWGRQFQCTNGFSVNWNAQSPDGRSGMALLPAQGWEWNQFGAPTVPGCPVAQIRSIEAYLQAIVPDLFAGGRIVSIRPRPDIEAQRAQQNGVQDDGFQRVETRVRAADAHVEFNKNGEPMRGIVTTLVTMTHITSGGAYTGGAIVNLMGWAESPFVAYGPAATFQPAVFEAMRISMISNPPWAKKISEHISRISIINIDGMRDRAQIQAQTASDIARMQQQAWQDQQHSADARAQAFIQSIRDVQTYQDGSVPGGQVELSSLYNQAWRLEDGTYVLTDDPSFQPYQTFGISGQQLSAAR
ncbi:MAG: hypothetical protein ACR2PZ_24600 [Pseudomonadales bacterium]